MVDGATGKDLVSQTSNAFASDSRPVVDIPTLVRAFIDS